MSKSKPASSAEPTGESNGSFHPGGEELSTKLVDSLGMGAGSSVLDVACGVGTTTRIMANAFGLNATGLDFSEINVQKASVTDATPASDAAEPCCAPGDPCCSPDAGLAQLGGAAQDQTPVTPGTLNFVQGSADALPQSDSTFDAVTCECAVSTFADQPRAAAEFYRVLKPGGMFGMTDMVLNGELPDDFAEKAAPWTCVARAMTTEGRHGQSLGRTAIARNEHHGNASDAFAVDRTGQIGDHPIRFARIQQAELKVRPNQYCSPSSH